MVTSIRHASIDAALIFGAIGGALIAGLASGHMLDAGQVDILSWWPFIVGAALLLAVIDRIRNIKWRVGGLFLWAFAGGWVCVLVLCSIAAQAVPSLSSRGAPTGPRERLALNSALTRFGVESRFASALEDAYEVENLDVLSRASLSPHHRLLLAQPRLLAPEELVALDDWLRGGGEAVILTDPLLLRSRGGAPGDRNRPPVTSLLDPLLSHWGLTLEAATAHSPRRVFVEGDRLLVIAGASRFTVRASPFSRCVLKSGGLMALCRVGRGEVRLIADADLLDERLWLSGEGVLAGDNMALLERWLRQPLRDAAPWPGARIWVRGEQEIMLGMRWALIAAAAMALLGAWALNRRHPADRYN